MCGIAGHLRRRDAADPAITEAQLRLLDHRGPDSWGVFSDGRAAIGQTRLAIIDLVTGDPPIVVADGTIGAAFNGEIYNFRELRAELAADGHELRTSGDTETIAHLAERCEPVELARRLDGMFAFAVWDGRRERLVLGRDRLGKKPLYVWHDDRELVFGSEIKALLGHPAVPNRLDETAIPSYLRFGYVPSPRTIYDGITAVPPGHVLVVDREFRITVEAFWRPTVPGLDGTATLDLPFVDAAAEVRQGLDDAVRRRMVSDVPLGAFLSGGLDSSAVVALMAAASNRPVKTFTIGFEDGEGFDERPHAQLVADRLGTEHTEFVVAPQAVDLVEDLVWHHDQPFGDSSAVPTYLLSRLTRQHVTVALCGDGGDELFAGYERFGAGVAADRLHRLPPATFRLAADALAHLPSAGGRRAKVQRFLGAAATGLPDAFLHWISYLPGDLVEELVPGGDQWGVADYRRRWEATSGAATLDRLLLLNLETYLVDDLLPKVDRMSMAHGLEVRAPFLDHHLVELALRLRPSAKARGMSLKRALKQSMRGLLPDEIIDRPKHGFGVPLDRWFREDLSGYLDATIGAPDAHIRHHLSGPTLDRILAEHRAGTSGHGHALWTLLTLEVFLRRQGW